jgi:hypothetical protein
VQLPWLLPTKVPLVIDQGHVHQGDYVTQHEPRPRPPNPIVRRQRGIVLDRVQLETQGRRVERQRRTIAAEEAVRDLALREGVICKFVALAMVQERWQRGLDAPVVIVATATTISAVIPVAVLFQPPCRFGWEGVGRGALAHPPQGPPAAATGGAPSVPSSFRIVAGRLPNRRRCMVLVDPQPQFGG